MARCTVLATEDLREWFNPALDVQQPGLTPLQPITALYALVTSAVSGNAENQLRAV